MNPLHNYDQWKAGDYSATVDEWEDWADRIVAAFRAELKAAENDYTKNKALLEALERALRHLEEKIEIGMFYETEIIRQDLREAIRKAKEK